jgi:heat shock protein HtpX
MQNDTAVVGRLGMEAQVCPQCQTTLPVHAGYIIWCDTCEWNLQPREADPPENIFQSIYASLGKRSSHGLFQELVQAKSLKPKLTIPEVLAVFLATLAHGLSILTAGLGLLLINSMGVSCLGIVGVVLLATAWLVRPQLPKLDKDDEVIPKKAAPTLYKTVGKICRALDTDKVQIMVVNEQWNAAFTQIGWKRRKVVYIGLPLFSVLDAQERVALLSHEVAHGVNGDMIRSFYVGSAISSLVNWYDIIHPEYMWDPDVGHGVWDLPGNLVRAALSGILYLWISALANLLWRESQRAEYLADALAANVSGTPATLSMLDKLHLGSAFFTAVQRVSLSNRNHDLFEELHNQIAGVPKRELERIRRVEKMDQSRLDTSHPPTAYRIELLQARPVFNPKVTLSEDDFERMNQELAALQAPIQEKLLDLHRQSLYY